MSEFTALEKQKEAEREVALRRNVYPKFVASGRLTQAKAERQIQIMAAIAADYKGQVEAQIADGDASWLKD